MAHNKHIKNFLKPRKGNIQQGYFNPSKPEKYIGDIHKIIFRSSWELRFLRFCDSNDSVLQYSSEPLGIPYFSPLDKRGHTYYIDFAVILRDGDGVITNWLIEVKPSKQLSPPEAPKRLTDKALANYLNSSKQYIINRAKFEAAKDFAVDRGFKFGIVTENFIFQKV